MTSETGRRRARVEMALVREGEGLNMAALARELGVSRWTVRRDALGIRARWAALAEAGGEALAVERARTAAAYEVVTREALGQYERAAAEGHHNAAVGYLRVATDAMEKRARLLGLEEIEAEPREFQLNVRYVDRLGQVSDKPHWMRGTGNGHEAGEDQQEEGMDGYQEGEGDEEAVEGEEGLPGEGCEAGTGGGPPIGGDDEAEWEAERARWAGGGGEQAERGPRLPPPPGAVVRRDGLWEMPKGPDWDDGW